MNTIQSDHNIGTVLIADDDKNIVFAFRKLFTELKWEVIEARDGEETLEKIDQYSPDVIYMDIQMPGINGLEILTRLKQQDFDIPVVIITGYGTMQTAIDAVKSGAYEYITKPLDVERVRTLAHRALEVQQLKSEVQKLRRQIGYEPKPYELIGQSQKMQNIYKQIGTSAVTPNETTILITGESGTGKELVARTIHNNGPNADSPFQAINCTVLPETLLESELFGHEKGAFTGAIERKRGKFELAGNGTIFLDEIGDIHPNFQKKLLRVLQEREYERVGGTQLIPVRARFIAATHQDLPKKIDKGEFREDLYYRLNVLTINIPPLLEHKEDIPQLCQHFLYKANRKFGKKAMQLSSDLLQALHRYNFPGNVRELEHIIERGVATTKSDILDIDILPSELGVELSQQNESRLHVPILSRNLTEAREIILKSFERNFIIQRLKESGGNVSEAAKISGIERQSFQRLMRKHNINSEHFRK